MAKRKDRPANTPPGPGVDATGQAVIDPTENVLQLVKAAIERVDDLRILAETHRVEIAGFQEKIADLRELHAKELREGEAARLDAIRSVDVGAVQRAAEAQAAAATALAATVAQAAEAMRTQVAATAAASNIQLATALQPLQDAIADLRQAQYTLQGEKTQQVETRAQGMSTGMWVGVAAAVGFGCLTILISLVMMLVSVAGLVYIIITQ